MTERKSTTGGGKRPKRGPGPELVVSPEEAERLIEDIRGGHFHEDETVARFLLLIHSTAYCDPLRREDYLTAAERVLMPSTRAFEEGSRALRRSAFDSLRQAKGGA